ncbi:MAG: aminoglycoside adenylyltransferase domain-containing protein [Eubacteriales bacterium]
MMNISGTAKKIINEHINMIETRLPDFLASYYIYGSVSLGAFDYEKSDIDFIAVIKRKATETDIKILKNIHSNMHRKFRKTILDGMYLLDDDVAFLKYNHEIPCLRFNDVEFKGFQKFYRDSIDAFQLIKYGITVKGQETGKPDYVPDFDILISKMRDNLNTYWLHWLHECRRFPSIKCISLLVSLKSVEWGVLGVSRQYYTFRERDITSKVGAGEYALQNLPEKWHKILKEAMRLRKDNHKSYYNSVFERRSDALDYIDIIIKKSNIL